MAPEYEGEILAAWIMTRLWQGGPPSILHLEAAAMDFPFTIDQAAFEAGSRFLQVLKLVDKNLELTDRGRQARELPGHGKSYESRFTDTLARLKAAKAPYKINDLKRQISHDFTAFFQLQTLMAKMDEALNREGDES